MTITQNDNHRNFLQKSKKLQKYENRNFSSKPGYKGNPAQKDNKCAKMHKKVVKLTKICEKRSESAIIITKMGSLAEKVDNN